MDHVFELRTGTPFPANTAHYAIAGGHNQAEDDDDRTIYAWLTEIE